MEKNAEKYSGYLFIQHFSVPYSAGNGSNLFHKSESDPRDLHTRPLRPFGRISDESSDRDQITSDESQEAMRIFATSPPDHSGGLGTTPTGLPSLG